MLQDIVLDQKEKDECAICLEVMDKMSKLQCRHKFCLDCVSYLKAKEYEICPLCRQAISEVEVVEREKRGYELFPNRPMYNTQFTLAYSQPKWHDVNERLKDGDMYSCQLRFVEK